MTFWRYFPREDLVAKSFGGRSAFPLKTRKELKQSVALGEQL
jgi:hypothetical protein